MPDTYNSSASIQCGDDAESFRSHPIMMTLGEFNPVENMDAEVFDFLIDLMGRYLIEHAIFRSSHYRETLDFVYGRNDGQLYSVVSSAHDDHYDFFVIHSDYFHYKSIKHMHARQIFMDCVSFLRSLNRYQKEEIASQEIYIHSVLRQIRRTLVYTRRRGSGVKEDKGVIYPSLDELKIFYECERKISYASLEEGLKYCDGNKEVYRCEHCGGYHQGHPPQVSPEDGDPVKVINRYKLTWRRYQSSGRLDKIAQKKLR